MVRQIARLIAPVLLGLWMMEAVMAAQPVKVSKGSDSVNLENGKVSVTFGTSDKRLALTSISGRGGERLGAFGPGASLWKLDLRGPENASREVGSGEAELTGVRAECSGRASVPAIPGSRPAQRHGHYTAGRTEFTWTIPLGPHSAIVTMSVRLEAGDPISYWSLKVKLPQGWKLMRADFPIIPNVKQEEGLKLAAPAGWGVEYSMRPGVGYGGTYPSCSAAMQFVAFYNHGRGLYIAAHDPNANHKRLSASAREDGVGATIANYPAVSDGMFTLPYDIAVGVFDGDYWDAAQIYRKWTFTTKWGSAGLVSKRPIPDWVKDTDLWLRPDGSAEQNVEVTKQALAFFDVPTSLHWYRWHQIPYDTLYPEYFPPLPGFAEGIREVQDAGTYVMPYINGRLCDPNSKTWIEGGDKWAARQENGEPYTEVYGSKVPLNAMCPYTAQWQDKVSGLVKRMISELNVNGVYIDQICAAYPVQCFDPSHGHPIGGGDFWYRGYRKLLDKTRKLLPKDRMITTEENAECWLDQFDALLLVNSPTGEHPIIPLWPAVYSGRVINFGFLYYPATDLQKGLPFDYKTARCFIFGAQLGWIQPALIMAEENRDEAEYLRTLARTRRFAHGFLTDGRFLGLITPTGDNPRLTGEGSGSFSGSYKIDTPSVIGSAWQAEDGALGVLLANMSDGEHEVEVHLPLVRVGITASKGFTIERIGPDGLESSARSTSAEQTIKVPGRSAVVLVVR